MKTKNRIEILNEQAVYAKGSVLIDIIDELQELNNKNQPI